MNNTFLFALLKNPHHNWLLSVAFLLFAQMVTFWELPRFIYLFFVYASFVYFMFSVYQILFVKKGKYVYHFPRNELFVSLLILCFITISRGIVDEGIGYQAFMHLYPHPKLLMPYFFIILIGYSARAYDYRAFYKISSLFTIILLLVVVFNIQDIITFSYIKSEDIFFESDFNITQLAGFLTAPLVIFLQRDIVPKKVWRISILNILIALFLAVVNARRSTLFGIALVLLLGIRIGKRGRWISSLLILVLIYFLYQYGLTDFLMAKWDVDTRSGVVDAFYEDMDLQSWLIGRGATGTYYDPLSIFEDIGGMRSEIETGYLDLILKGGIIYLLFYVLCLGYAAYLGLRRSKNAFVRSFAIIILVSILELIPYGIPTWNLKFFSIWMGVAICLTPKLRAMTNAEIKSFLKLE